MKNEGRKRAAAALGRSAASPRAAPGAGIGTPMRGAHD